MKIKYVKTKVSKWALGSKIIFQNQNPKCAEKQLPDSRRLCSFHQPRLILPIHHTRPRLRSLWNVQCVNLSARVSLHTSSGCTRRVFGSPTTPHRTRASSEQVRQTKGSGVSSMTQKELDEGLRIYIQQGLEQLWWTNSKRPTKSKAPDDSLSSALIRWASELSLCNCDRLTSTLRGVHQSASARKRARGQMHVERAVLLSTSTRTAVRGRRWPLAEMKRPTHRACVPQRRASQHTMRQFQPARVSSQNFPVTLPPMCRFRRSRVKTRICVAPDLPARRPRVQSQNKLYHDKLN